MLTMSAEGPDRTTYANVVDRFGRSRRAAAELSRWRALPGKEPVVGFAEQMQTVAAYQVSPEQVEFACEATRHALEGPEGRRLRRSVGESIAEVANWYPNFPIVHSLYWAVEHLQRPPLWDEFIALWREKEPARTMLGVPAARAVTAAEQAGRSRADAEEAMWWRLGNAYYSLLRELYVLAVLRDSGRPVEYHVLADALFRVDFWLGDTVISLYVANERYRDARGAGRKLTAGSLLSDFTGFRFVEMPRLTRREYGTVHLPARGEIERFAERFLT